MPGPSSPKLSDEAIAVAEQLAQDSLRQKLTSDPNSPPSLRSPKAAIYNVVKPLLSASIRRELGVSGADGRYETAEGRLRDNTLSHYPDINADRFISAACKVASEALQATQAAQTPEQNAAAQKAYDDARIAGRTAREAKRSNKPPQIG